MSTASKRKRYVSPEFLLESRVALGHLPHALLRRLALFKRPFQLLLRRRRRRRRATSISFRRSGLKDAAYRVDI